MASSDDGVFRRKDRKGFWIPWTDAQGQRCYRKTNARILAEARSMRASELLRVEQTKALGFAPPGKETFADVAARFLAYQKARLTAKAYERERGVIKEHLSRFFAGEIAAIRRADVQR